MAQTELYKDRIEVSLDGPQIFYLFFGGAVIVGLVFVLGVMVGRRVEARGHVERAHVATAVDPLAALDRLEAGSGLTFQGALRGGETKPPEVDKKIAAIAASRQSPEEKKVDKADDKKPKLEDKKPEDKKVDKVEDKKAEKTDDKKPDDKKSEDKKADDKKSEDKVADDKKPDDKKPDDKKKSDDKKPDEKKPRYTLQLSSFQDRSEADAYMASIKSAGFSAFVSEGEVDGKQFYRVRVGSYRSIDAANDAKSDFEKATKKSALVTKL
jgi:cell division protein FtsN